MFVSKETARLENFIISNWFIKNCALGTHQTHTLMQLRWTPHFNQVLVADIAWFHVLISKLMITVSLLKVSVDVQFPATTIFWSAKTWKTNAPLSVLFFIQPTSFEKSTWTSTAKAGSIISLSLIKNVVCMWQFWVKEAVNSFYVSG